MPIRVRSLVSAVVIHRVKVGDPGNTYAHAGQPSIVRLMEVRLAS